jgi:AraC family transcriptional regulator of adaptative response / DNA-3-methyladenine glycosylase II
VNDDARYDALVTRDRRFDGVFFVGVSTTGIYCRPICPARTPGRTRCSFYQTPAQAETAGFRACFRCRPELAPGSIDGLGSVDAVDQLVATAAARIAEGALNEASVDELAAELGVSARHLRRATEARLGVSPVALAQTRRLGLAKQLLQDTGLPLTEIAFAAGFASVRRFNAVFAEVMGSSPSALRRKHVEQRPSALALRLDYRAPYDWNHVLRFLAARAIPGVEVVADGVYRRNVHLDGVIGAIEVRQLADRDALQLAVAPALVPVLMPLVARVRRLFDLDARPDVIANVLKRDRTLAPLVAGRPGLRMPGAIDGFEAAVRAMLGQQVSVAAATTLAGRFTVAFGAKHDGGDGLTHRFPTAAEVVAAGSDAIAKVGLPGARAAAIHGIATAIASGSLRLDGHDLDGFVVAATALPGIGPWTAHYLAMRALHLPDAFPAADLGIRKATGANARDAEARAEAWRPFRSYAVMHLWTSLGGDAENVANNDDRIAARDAAPRGARRRASRRVSAGPVRAVRATAARRRDRAAHAAARQRRLAARRVLCR